MRSLIEGLVIAFVMSLLLEQGNRVTRALTWCWSRLVPARVREEYRGHWEADVAAIEGPASRIGAACLLGTDLPGLWKVYGTAAEARFVGLRLLMGCNLLACLLAVVCLAVQWVTRSTLAVTYPVNLATSWCALVIILMMVPFLWQDVRQHFRTRSYFKGLYEFSAVALFFVPMAVSCMTEIIALPHHTGSLALSSLLFSGLYVTVLYTERRERQKRVVAG